MEKPVVDHIGFVVEDLGAALALFKGLFGVEPLFVKEKKEMGLKSAGLEFANVNLELIEFTGEPGEIAGLLGRRPGINHLGVKVASMEEAQGRLACLGLGLASGFPRPGSRGPIAFNSPAGAQGFLFELVQAGPNPQGA